MRSENDPVERLSAAIDQLAAGDAAQVLAEARAEARAQVRSRLTDAYARSLLEQITEHIGAPLDEPGTAQPDAVAEIRPQSELEGELGWYVYGVVHSGPEPTTRLLGVDGTHPIAVLREGALTAVASQVSLEQFGEDRLREHLSDMAWVEAVARRHEQVLDHVRAETTVIPMRMCTVYRSESRVREMLRRESSALEQAIEHLQGKTEWGVKVFVDFGAVEEGPDSVSTQASHPDGAGDARGAAYMARKRQERQEREQSLELIDEASSLIHDRLSSVANDALVVPLQRPEVTGHDGEMVLSGVYLVRDDARKRFDLEVTELQAEFGPRGFELELTGPWPAYNFVPGTIGAAW